MSTLFISFAIGFALLMTLASINLKSERERNRIINFLCCGDYTARDFAIAMPDIDEPRLAALLDSLCKDGRVKRAENAYHDVVYKLNLECMA